MTVELSGEQVSIEAERRTARPIAQALLAAAQEVAGDHSVVRTASEGGRLLFVVPVEVADAANDALVAIHADAHDDSDAPEPAERVGTEPREAESEPASETNAETEGGSESSAEPEPEVEF